MKEKFQAGKLNPVLLKRLLQKCQGRKDKRVIVGPKIGEDATIIDFSDRYLVVKTDPITYTSQILVILRQLLMQTMLLAGELNQDGFWLQFCCQKEKRILN